MKRHDIFKCNSFIPLMNLCLSSSYPSTSVHMILPDVSLKLCNDTNQILVFAPIYEHPLPHSHYYGIMSSCMSNQCSGSVFVEWLDQKHSVKWRQQILCHTCAVWCYIVMLKALTSLYMAWSFPVNSLTDFTVSPCVSFH